MSIKVLIVDDHPIVSTGIRAASETNGIEVISHISNVNEMQDAYRDHHPDVVVMEMRMAGRDALSAVEPLTAEFPDCRLIAFTAQTNPTYVARAAALGCKEYLVKTCGCEILIAAIHRVASDHPTPDDSLLVTTRAKIRRVGNYRNSNSPLTNREMQVLQHVSMGLSNREVGKSLGISVETVKEHVQNILRKLDVNDRTQAAVWAVKQGFV